MTLLCNKGSLEAQGIKFMNDFLNIIFCSEDSILRQLMYVLTFQGMFCDSQSVSHIGSFESSYALPGNFFFYVFMVVLAFWLVLI